MNNILIHADQYIELNLRECGREKCIPQKAFDFTVKDYHLFHYVVMGEGYLEMGGKKYHLHKGNIFYIPPKEHPVYYPDQNEPWTYCWLGFDGSNAAKYLSESGISIENPIVHDRNDFALKTIFDGIYDRYQEAGFLDLRCLGLAYQIFDILLGLSPTSSDIPLSAKERIVKSGKEFIANNYQFAITVDDIAKSMGVTPNYLANIFSESIGLSPKRYLTNYRMDKACLLLKTKRYKIKEVGKKVGYENQLHFSTEFKKQFGVSPLQYIHGEADEPKEDFEI